MGRARHLGEEYLFECYISERSGEAVDPPAASHLAACGACAARYGELRQFMEGLREHAEGETDAVFTAEQLRRQQQQILRRIEHLGQPARVLSFPASLVRRHLTAAATDIAPRWAVAAAAGLLVGVAVGVFFNDRTTVTPMTVARPARAAVSTVMASSPASVDDDAFLSELESALGGSHNQELLPFDALTPRVQEISSRPLRY